VGVSIAGAVAASLLAVLALQSTNTAVHVAAPVLLAGVAAWMFFSERYERTLAVLLLYLGLLDGFLKLKTGSTIATLGRDVLLYSFALGVLVRAMLRRHALPSPPLLFGVVAWVFLCVAQIFNPAAVSLTHAAAAIRQHIEFVPLFFAGYLVLRSKERLAGLFVLLIIVAAVNGVVALVQEHLTPGQLASWGPGYATEVFGSGTLSAREFYVNGVFHVRPPALGGDFGFGGAVGLIALPGTLALLSGGSRLRQSSWVAWLGGPLVILAIATSQARTDVVAAAVALIAFLGLTVTSRRGATVLVAALALAALSYLGATQLIQGTGPNRYSSIAPSKVVSTTVNYRASTLSLIPTYALAFPLGAGMGSAGPAAYAAVGGAVTGAARGLDAESEFTFLEIELGLPGLAILLTLTGTVIWFGIRLRRIADPALQRALMALTAVSIGVAAVWIVGPVSATSPFAPFFWLCAGTMAYWYGEIRCGRVQSRSRPLRAALAGR
jgi:hypothetical protein